MAEFDLYAPFLKRWEGGFVNDPYDPGGATNMGVTLATYRRFYGSGRTVEDLKRIKSWEWKRIMKTYWDKVWGDRITRQGVAEMVADWHINAGLAGIKAAQRAVGVDADGIVGRKTLAAFNAPGAFALLKAGRAAYYTNLVNNRPVMGRYLKGWLNRTNAIVDR